MNNVYVLGGLRTPIAIKNGKFKNVRAEELGATVLCGLRNKYNISALDGVIAGNAVGTGGNIARLTSLLAGFSESVPAFTADMQCASGAAAIAMGYSLISSGNGACYICGGMESSSLQPLRIYHENDPRYSMTPAKNGEYYTAQFTPDEMAPDAMLWGAERTIAAENITKKELDRWTILSHQRAAAAKEKGYLKDLIIPVLGHTEDDGIRPKMNQRLIDRLPKILGKNTSITAGNSCLINDGAAFAVLVSDKWLCQHTAFKPEAKIVGTAMAGSNSIESPRGAMHTADVLLDKLQLGYDDMNAIEFNEAFAVIDVLFERRYPDKTNIYNRLGGALAYGHPYGASGGILLLHLLKSLKLNGGGKGILSIAGAGGMGQAIAIESV